MNDIMKNIKRLRQRKGLTQEELGAKLHVTRQAVSNWETGKNQPDIEILKSLAEILEVDVNELLYAPKPDMDRQRRIITAAVFCAMAVVAWVGYFSFERWAIAWQGSHYELRPAILCIWVLKPLAYVLTGIAAAAFARVWVNVQPKTKFCRGMLDVGAVICLIYIFFVLWYWFGYQIGFTMPKQLSFVLGNYWWSRGQWVFLIPGVLFFLGWPRKAG